ncbi:MAG TPA: hypothetical protein VHE55_07170 [Fimbriimonadaceae bacterium]|nr:hypothetical protein [Fimbriimonadaceae bacterium]
MKIWVGFLWLGCAIFLAAAIWLALGLQGSGAGPDRYIGIAVFAIAGLAFGFAAKRKLPPNI